MFDIDLIVELGNEKFNYEILSNSKVIVVMGESGAGKTTFLKSIAGLLEPKSGHLILKDKCYFSESTNILSEKRNFSYVFQSKNLFPHLTVKDNLNFGLKGNESKVDKWLEKLGILHLKDKKPKALSGGEAQRVALGRAFFREPDLFLLDEPFSSLDAMRKEKLYKVLHDEIKEFKGLVIMVTHDIKEAYEFAEEIFLLENRKLRKMEVDLLHGIITKIEEEDKCFLIDFIVGDKIYRSSTLSSKMKIGDNVVGVLKKDADEKIPRNIRLLKKRI